MRDRRGNYLAWLAGAAFLLSTMACQTIETPQYSPLLETGKLPDENYIQSKCLYITNCHFNAGGNDNFNLNDEYVTFGNRCSYSINMTGWTIRDETSLHVYTFPSFSVDSGAAFTLYTGTGKNTKSTLYWGRTPGDYAAVWNNNGDTLGADPKKLYPPFLWRLT